MIGKGFLALIAFLLSVYALRISYPVTMPIAATAVVIAIVWPIKPWLDRVLPSSIATLGTVVVLLVVVLGFIAALYFCAVQVVAAFANNQARFEKLYEDALAWAHGWGLDAPGGEAGYQQLLSFGQAVLTNLYSMLVYVGFVGVLVSLALPEVPVMRAKLRQELDVRKRRETADAIDAIASRIRAYFGVTTLASLITGVACGVWAAIIGVELALVWGILNFLLNYIPVAGNIIGILPPTLYALTQFDGWVSPLLLFIGLSVIQLVVSNFVAPLMSGRSLSLSPAAIIVALSFWSWVWGIAGALIAIPLTAAITIICEHFESTRWIAVMLAEKPRRKSDSR